MGEFTIVNTIQSKGDKLPMSVKIKATFDSTASTTNGAYQKRINMSISFF